MLTYVYITLLMLQCLPIDCILKKLKLKRILKKLYKGVRIEWSLTNIHEKIEIKYYSAFEMQDWKNVVNETVSSAT